MTKLVDAVIVFTLLEGLALLALHRATGRGPAPRDFALNLASGLCLMLALDGVLRDAGSGWLALCLLGAGLAHGSDIAWRVRRRPAAPAFLVQESAR